jgi:hypothetical protein
METLIFGEGSHYFDKGDICLYSYNVLLQMRLEEEDAENEYWNRVEAEAAAAAKVAEACEIQRLLEEDNKRYIKYEADMQKAIQNLREQEALEAAREAEAEHLDIEKWKKYDKEKEAKDELAWQRFLQKQKDKQPLILKCMSNYS